MAFGLDDNGLAGSLATRGEPVPEDATLLRVRLPDRPGGLALFASSLAEHGVNILRLEVVHWHEGAAVDDVLVVGGELDRALAELPSELEIIARRERGELPDPGLAMAEACAAVTGSSGLGEARQTLLGAALALVDADAGVVLRDAGHGWLRPLAATVDALPPIRGGPSLPGKALGIGRPCVASGAEDWAPPVYHALLGNGAALAIPAGIPPYLCLLVVRHEAFPFVEAEIERLEALVQVGVGVLTALGERPVQEPELPALRIRLGGLP